MMQALSKRQRVSSGISDKTDVSYLSNSKTSLSNLEDDEKPRKLEKLSFDDKDTGDVMLQLAAKHADELHFSSEQGELEIEVHLHSVILSQCRYFAALFSDRWQEKGLSDEANDDHSHFALKMCVPSIQALGTYMCTLQLLYTKDFSEVIVEVQTALSILPVAVELLFEECITACVRFLEAVPWSKEEEAEIKQLVCLLQLQESEKLLARLSPVKNSAVEDMLNELVYAATHSHQNAASVKAFVAKILSTFPSRDTVRLVLNRAFVNSLKTVKDSVEEYTSPNVRGRYDEIEAMQRQNLHTAVVSGRHLLWLVERMIELRVAETAVQAWSEQRAFTANLQGACSDDMWRNNVPGLPAVLLRCTCRLLNAMVAGSILTSQNVRKRLARDWLPVLVTSRENVSYSGLGASCNKQLHKELEVGFLQLIMTLPITDAQELLQQCLSFATRSIEDCPHLVSAFNTWFQRAGQGNLGRPGKSNEKEACPKICNV
ncbi:hypothetical protein O6H91_01G162400 [Diphasiastrum complanatum]|uniref:Uncharacterized protein n=7 Tax=Diphasiastrum complanatum TaxID=34168 RepID=A0ACC2EY04_DIPCM|nr:hypothetical protein O6H91_01G162400 [Diphasiastrum complanatum]KAJ7571411.1 hypothetical protein O6H91_01G162400 [Diphasiastrum complanatum]KAJ7571414.1 hypothetical protein O6H91_01G162400 [Diphasiastrum complanatum]